MTRRLGRGWRLAAALVLSFCLWGCGRDTADEPGVVAVVNGSPIRLAELEMRNDVSRISQPAVDNPAVEDLRAGLGAALADAVVARLVGQELKRLGQAPTPEELEKAEAAVRADYPGEAFERMLLEEHIDLARWREMLADRLALEKFRQDVLLPGQRVGVSEAAAYYKEHQAAFARPAMVTLRVVSGRDAEAVKAALAAARKSGQGEASLGREAVMPEAGLPQAWRDALRGKKPGEATPPLAMGREHVALVLVERTPAAMPDPAKAYARVEARLTEEKLTKAFDAWLAKALGQATIRVNARLLPAAAMLAQIDTKDGDAELVAAKVQEEASVYVAGAARRALADRQPTAASPASPDEPPASPPSAPPADETITPALAPALPVPEQGARPVAPPPASTPSSGPAEPAVPGESGAAASRGTASAPAPPPVSDEARVREGSAARPVANGAKPAQVSGSGPDSNAAGRDEASAAFPEATPAQPTPADRTGSQPEALQSGAAATVAGNAVGQRDAAASGQPPGPIAGPGEVEFTAVKASWILYTADDGREERVYLKPGKPHRVAYSRRLTVRLGSPSEVAYRAGARAETVEVGKKESRVLEFP
ncbi:peptidyl-prolyl cis-trans isomerase [Solidesulfovibrio magneticus]|uniref:PpiC domain-containing protein n=1 Tax=Solidesulfovibrio magneticus (strain ATCC 700980 / DSM 13731 / RS-1) TaxID=573370 RepID=C4XS48_SOLM1|nr:peptidyl-prolyl cis-trans isomerase [Solidesulfovibrio magneticus]BAH75570.1 hypothetical protein DMR_20790 [Solidesulfovibrio magneticus RS-1]